MDAYLHGTGHCAADTRVGTTAEGLGPGRPELHWCAPLPKWVDPAPHTVTQLGWDVDLSSCGHPHMVLGAAQTYPKKRYR